MRTTKIYKKGFGEEQNETLNKIYTYAANQQTHADKIWFITYYHIYY